MGEYPIRYRIDHDAGERSRGWAFAGVFFFVKALALVPHIIALFFIGIVAGVLLWVSYIVILFTGSIPDWGVRWIQGALDWSTRTQVWLVGLTDEYPAFGLEAESPGRLEVEIGDPTRSRGLAALGIIIIKALLALPHLIVVSLIGYVVFPVAWVGYLIVLFTGKFPEGLHRFFVGYINWSVRTAAWIGSLTDAYPPFEWDDGSTA